MTWFSAGIVTNPATDAILADSGALAGDAGPQDVSILVGGTVLAVLTIEHRNAANGANLFSQVITSPANDARQFWVTTRFNSSERVRVRLNVGVTGSLQSSIFLT
jgi:hypothetical protein